jgi:hypothetical protein
LACGLLATIQIDSKKGHYSNYPVVFIRLKSIISLYYIFNMRRITSFTVLLLTCAAITAYGQSSATDPDWGENQHIQERAAYWHAIEVSGPDTNVAEARLRGYNQFISIPRPKGMMIQSSPAWEQVGGGQGIANPNTGHASTGSVSGRPTSIAFDPVNNQVFYLGTSGGGLWKTTDNGNTWVNLSDTWSSYAMGGVAVDYSDHNTIYAATGDLYDRPGDGFYKSTDGGMNWVHTVNSNIIGTQCNQVLIDPQVNTTLYVTSSGGVSKSTDAGVTWKKLLNLSGTTHMVIDPTNGQNLYLGGAGSIRKSTDGGATWNKGDLASNISNKYTITLGISKSDVSKIYASIGDASTGGSLGVARSDNYGDSGTWTLVWNRDNYMSQQAFYDNACAVSPNNANDVVVGGLDIWGSTNGGSALNQYTQWGLSSASGNFTHADIHVLAYSPSGGLYALTDGGIFYSGNNGSSWLQSKNNALSTMLFVGGDAASDFSFVVGGAQDNGVNHAFIGDKAFAQAAGGDGGRAFISQADPTIAYGTYIYASLEKSGDGGRSFSGNMIQNQSLLSESVPFYMNYDVSESDGATIAICGGTNVYYSPDGGNSIDAITKSSSISGGPVSCHVATADPSVVYVGSNSQYVYMNNDAANLNTAAWVKSTAKIGVAAGFVTDPSNAGNVWAVIQGYGGQHFYRSTDFGKTWTAPATNLPDLSATTIARNPDNGDLFIGHTFGVMRSIDNGDTWEAIRDGLPLCQVTKLRVRGTANQYLLATTYGRGMYRIDISQLPRTISSVSASAPSADMPAITSISPNPIQVNGHAKVMFRIAKESDATLILYDELGREVKTLLKEYLSQGDQSAEADISSLPSGVYYAVLTSDGHAVTQRFVVAK